MQPLSTWTIYHHYLILETEQTFGIFAEYGKLYIIIIDYPYVGQDVLTPDLGWWEANLPLPSKLSLVVSTLHFLSCKNFGNDTVSKITSSSSYRK